MKKNWLSAIIAATSILTITSTSLTTHLAKNKQVPISNCQITATDYIKKCTNNMYSIRINVKTWAKIHDVFKLMQDEQLRIQYLTKNFSNYQSSEKLDQTVYTGLAFAVVKVYKQVNVVLFKQGVEFNVTTTTTKPLVYTVQYWNPIS